MTNLVCGVGINNRKYPAYISGKHTKEYALWNSLLKRCYSIQVHKIHPTYLGCQASENFKSYAYFYEWCQNQIGFGQKGFHLDKDLISKNNKVYSENTCLFLPHQLNVLLISNKVCRGELPIGVYLNKGKFRVKCSTGTPQHIGYFDTPEEAFKAYKQVKEAFIKTQAEKWKTLIDPRAYAALMTYEVSITD